ncbi:hypothetical protein HID58_094796 [Brassica napus]|uniref:Uncharacterized protein n=1 Tax=Brassica napus TaxID=3708 RepID=A0ABQ7X7P5_BRANA|nr:hypothetical protein HID58_094796 [Brassica napus]
MKIIVMFLSVIVLVSSGAVNTMKISNLEERTHIFSPTATPLMNVQINDLQDEYRQGHGGSSLRRSNWINMFLNHILFFSLLPPISLPSLFYPSPSLTFVFFPRGRSVLNRKRVWLSDSYNEEFKK